MKSMIGIMVLSAALAHPAAAGAQYYGFDPSIQQRTHEMQQQQMQMQEMQRMHQERQLQMQIQQQSMERMSQQQRLNNYRRPMMPGFGMPAY